MAAWLVPAIAVAEDTGPAVTAFNLQPGSDSGTSQTDGLTNADTLVFDLVFDRPVSGLESTDFASRANAGCTFVPSASAGAVFTVTVSGCADGGVVAQLGVRTVSDEAGRSGPVMWAEAFVGLDRTPPDLDVHTWMREPIDSNAQAFVIYGDSIDCTTVSATPGEDFEILGQVVRLGPVESTDNTGTCLIPVLLDVPIDHAGWGALQPAATLRINDLAGNTATTADTSGAVVSVYRVDEPDAVVTGPATWTSGDPIPFHVAFDQPVTGLDAQDFRALGPAGCTIGAPVQQGTVTYAVLVSGCSGGLLDFFLLANSVVDDVGNDGPPGNVEAPEVTIDRSAPMVTRGPAVDLRRGATLSGSRIPVSVVFDARDEGDAGVARFEVSRSRDGGQRWSEAQVVAEPRLVTRIPSTGLVQFRVRAIDAAGNRGAWRYGRVVSARLLQEEASGLDTIGTWRRVTSTSLSGGSGIAASQPDARVRLEFTGSAIGWVATTSPTRGRARVYVDGVLRDTIDLWSASRRDQVLVWQLRLPTAGSHRVRLVVEGTPGRPKVGVDAFVLLR